jgi:hypothetical protein
MKALRPVRSRWIKPPAEPAPPTDSRMERAKRLPPIGPGLMVTVKLDILMQYMELHHLEPNGIIEPKVQPERGPGEAKLVVKRVLKKKEENDHRDPG